MQPANQPTSQPVNTSVVVAGNGPSLKEIDYRRLPKEFDVFRCNQFYLEDKYYLGKNIKGYFMAADSIEYNFSASFVLAEREEYSFRDLYCIPFVKDKKKDFLNTFFIIKSNIDIIFKKNEFASFIMGNYLVYNQYPTTGMMSILMAVALGYKDIYVTGIDFHKAKDGEMYAYSIKDKPYIFSKRGWGLATEEIFIDDWHTERTEKRLLEIVKNLEGVNIYSVSPDSTLSEILPLAPIQNDNPYVLEDKPEGYLKDIVVPYYLQQKEPPKGKIQKLKQKFIDKGLGAEWNFLRNNMFVGFFYQLIKIPYILLKIFVKFFIKK